MIKMVLHYATISYYLNLQYLKRKRMKNKFYFKRGCNMKIFKLATITIDRISERCLVIKPWHYQQHGRAG